MLLRVFSHQLVELLFQPIDAAVDLRDFDRGSAFADRPGTALRLLLELLANALAGLLGDTKLEPGVLDLFCNYSHLPDITLAAGAHKAHVFQPKSLHAGFRLSQLVLVILDLFVDEPACGVGSTAGSTETLFDERRQRRLDHVARLAAVWITEGNRVQVIPAASASDAERARRFVDQIGGVPASAGIEIGFANDFFKVRAAHQEAAENRDLLTRVWGDRHSAHQWRQQ